MTGFDLLAGAILLVSGLVGFVRGATREVVTVAAFVAGVAVSILTVHVSAPLAGHVIHTQWLARVAALAAVFLIVYIAVRLVGGALTRGVRRTALSGLDRVIGLAIGLARGAVVIAILALAILAATPPERMPRWYTHSLIYPEANAAGRALRALAPRGMAIVRHAAPTVENAVTGETSDSGDEASDAKADPASKSAGNLQVLLEKPRS